MNPPIQANRSVTQRALAAIAALVLLAVAYLHSTGTAAITEAVNGTDMAAFFIAAIPVLWLFFTWHLVAISLPLFWGAVFASSWLRAATVFVALVAIGDFIFVFSIAGRFPGTYLLLAVVVLLLIAAVAGRSRKPV